MKLIQVQDAQAPAGHYTPAVISDSGMIFISGQVPVDPKTSKIVKGDLETQFKQVLNNLKNILESAGASIEDILKVTIMIGNSDDWYQINQMYKEFMGRHKPARTILPVLPLHNGYLVEVEAIAELKK